MMNFPFLNIFDKNQDLFGFPLLYLYFIVGWAISIIVIYLFTLAVGDGEIKEEQTKQ